MDGRVRLRHENVFHPAGQANHDPLCARRYVERQFAFLQALAPRLPLVKPSFSRDEIRLLAYGTDPDKLPSLSVPHGPEHRKLISQDERHAMEKIWRDGPFIGMPGSSWLDP